MSDDLKGKWWAWHLDNPHVWQLFERFALEAIRAGATRTSGWLIVNRIRWETAVITRGDDFKISNDFVALYVRLFQHSHPKYRHMFSTKPAKRLGETKRAA
jgi:hypothetical protein